MTIYPITLTWNGKHHLEKLYPTFQKAAEKVHQDVIWFIRDNASTDGTEELVKSWDNELFVRYFKVDHNRDSFAKCNNFLIDKIREQEKIDFNKDYYLLLNNDITIEDPYSLKYMLDIIERDKTVGAVGAKMFYPKGKTIQHFGVCGSPKHGNMVWHVYSQDQDSIYTKKDKEFEAVTGAFMLVRCSCVEAMPQKKINEQYFYAFEDVDLCFNIKFKQGKKIVCCAKTNIIHYESASLEKNPVNKIYMSSNVNVFRKNWGGKYKLDYFDYMKDPNYNIYG